MGFFLTDEQVAETKSKNSNNPASIKENRAAAKKTTNSKIKTLDPNLRGCDNCTLKSTWPRITSPRMKLSGNTKDPEILILGEAPSSEDDRKGYVFSDEAGKLLRQSLPGRELDRIAFQGMTRCLPDNRTPTHAETHACSVHLEKDLDDLGSIKAIIGVGGVPLSYFFDVSGASILRAHGIPFPIKVGQHALWYYPMLHPSFVMRMKNDSKGFGDGPVMPVFKSDLKNFFNQVDRWKSPEIVDFQKSSVRIARTLEDAENLLSQMSGPLGVDIETLKLRPFELESRLLTAAFSDGKITFAFAIDHPELVNDWGLDFFLRTVRSHHMVFHGAHMELNWIRYLLAEDKNMPIENHGIWDDTMAIARLYFKRENIRGLDIVSRIVLGTNIKKVGEVDASRIMDYPLSEILPYNGLDALATRLIYDRIRRHVNTRDYERILGATDATVNMEIAGLPGDLEVAKQYDDEWRAKSEAAEIESKRIYEVRKYEQDTGKPFKIGSAEVVGKVLAEWGKLPLPQNKRSYVTDDEVLNRVAPDHPLVKRVLAYREAEKTRSTWIAPVLSAPSIYRDACIHPSYETTRTATLRRSSNQPNIQNWPKRRHRQIRRMVKANLERLEKKLNKRLVIAAFDQGQLEARLLAMASKDRNFCDKIISQYDIHSYWLERVIYHAPDYLDRIASKSNQTDEKAIRKHGRTLIKTDFVFSSFYGAPATSISRLTGIDLEIVRVLHKELWDEFPKILEWSRARRKEYERTGSILTLTGRERHSILWGNETINSPIQGTGADIMADCMAELTALARKHRDWFLQPRIDIHDDLTFFLPADDLDELSEYMLFIAKVMTKVRYDFQIVPLMVEAGIGDNWADLEEVLVHVGEDYVR